MNLNGRTLTRRMRSDLAEKDSRPDMPDKNPESPEMLLAEFVDVAETKGQGWVEYLCPKPGENQLSLKDT